MHADHTEIFSSLVRNTAQPHQAGNNRHSGHRDQLTQIRRCIRDIDPTANKNERFLSLFQFGSYGGNLSRLSGSTIAVAAQLDFIRIMVVDGCIKDIFGDIDHDRSRTTGTGNMKRFF
ncbi:hypothetical protein SDC9_179036 [bioreactor metagenome]|uniref:Uncharacterized protein n=1 Tax=bioreactor metagenome TaxID=1076179 RepID=A0A645GZT6_9ZZZZ